MDEKSANLTSLERLPTITEDTESQILNLSTTEMGDSTPTTTNTPATVGVSSATSPSSNEEEVVDEKNTNFERPSFDNRFEIDLEQGQAHLRPQTPAKVQRSNTLEMVRYNTTSSTACTDHGSFPISEAPPYEEHKKDPETASHNLFAKFRNLSRSFVPARMPPPMNAYQGSRACLPKDFVITDMVRRQQIITRIGQTLLWYGAPNYYIEEIMEAVSVALHVPASFDYRIGRINCEFMDCNDASSLNIQILETEGCNLKKLEMVFTIFIAIVKGKTSVEDAEKDLESVINSNDLSRWIRIPVFALAAASLGPFAFGATWKDMIVTAGLGLLIGVLQLYVYPRREDIATLSIAINGVVSSFIGAALSARQEGAVCLPALAQASVALTLPGYSMLIGTVEILSARNIQAGSARILYSIIWSYILAFGIGNAFTLYKFIDEHASFTDFSGCNSHKPIWSVYTMALSFTFCLQVLNKASFKQTVIGLFFGLAGFSAQFGMNIWVQWPQLSSFVGSFLVALLGNSYARWCNGVGWAVMLPGILLQVPGGLLAEGGLASALRMVDTVFSQTPNKDANMGFKDSVLENGFTVVEICVAITLGVMAGGHIMYLATGGKQQRKEKLFSF